MTGYKSKKAAAQDKLTVDRAQVEQWLQSLKDIDALHHPAEPESIDAQKALDDMGQVLDEDGMYLVHHTKGRVFDKLGNKVHDEDDDDTQIYKKPWIGLTPEEILNLFDSNNVYGSKWIEFARAVETKLKEKNT